MRQLGTYLFLVLFRKEVPVSSEFIIYALPPFLPLLFHFTQLFCFYQDSYFVLATYPIRKMNIHFQEPYI